MSKEHTDSVAALKAIYPNVTLVGILRMEDGEPIDPFVAQVTPKKCDHAVSTSLTKSLFSGLREFRDFRR